MVEDSMVNSFRYLLVFSIIGSLSLVGCKSGNKTNPVKANRAKATNPSAPKTTPKPGEQDKSKVGQGATPTKPGDTPNLPDRSNGNGSTPNSKDDLTTSNENLECKDYVAEMVLAGWEKKHVIAKKYTDNKTQLTILAFTPKNNLLKNPVLMLPNLRNTLDKSKSESFFELAKKHQFDPIFVDFRGTNCGEAFGNSSAPIDFIKESSAKALALEIEKIRKELIKDQAWKIWTNNSAGLIALRFAEQFSGKVKGLYLSNFAITEQYKDLVQAKIDKQIEIWNEFKTFAKSKDLDLSEENIKKIRDTLKKENCSSSLLCGEVGLNAYLLNRLSDKDEEWTMAVNTLKKLVQGEIPNEIQKTSLKIVENRLRYEVSLQITERNADLNNTACTTVTSKAEIKEKLEKSLIDSCLLESAVLADLKKSSVSLTSGGINLSLVKNNLAQSKAQYFVSMSKRSLMNPIELVEKHKEIMKDVFVDDFDTSLDFETFTNEGLLEKLK